MKKMFLTEQVNTSVVAPICDTMQSGSINNTQNFAIASEDNWQETSADSIRAYLSYLKGKLYQILSCFLWTLLYEELGFTQ